LAKKFIDKEEKQEVQKENSSEKSKTNLVEWTIFLFISVLLISLISVVFPALIASSNSTFAELRELGIVPATIDPFERGVWVGPLISSNVAIFGLAILYYKKKLPDSIKKAIDFVFSFEISKRVAIITIFVLLAIYVGFSVGELTIEEHWEDYPGVKERVENWSPEQVFNSFEVHVRFFLIWSSMNLFGYFTVIPFIASISLLVLTYFFTVEITKKRFAGIVAMVILLQSNIFLTYDSTVAYTNFWTLFYLLSLFLVYKFWPLSPVSYLLSLSSKPLTAMFLPMSLFFIYRCNISRRKKIIVGGSTSFLILAGVLASFGLGANLTGATGSQEEFDSDEFWLGFTSFSYQLRFDGLVLLFILPLTIGLFVASRYKILHADSILLLIGGILLTAPLLTGFTELTNQPYRFVPFVLFFAVGVGVLLSKTKR